MKVWTAAHNGYCSMNWTVGIHVHPANSLSKACGFYELTKTAYYRFSKPSTFVSFCLRLWFNFLFWLSLSSSLEEK